MNKQRHSMGLVIAALALAVMPLMGAPAAAQGDAHTFPETGKTVSGQFWAYWQARGGLRAARLPHLSGDAGEEST